MSSSSSSPSTVDNGARTLKLEQILVALDFEETSRRALEVGEGLADRLGAALTLVHVWDVPHYPYTSMATSALLKAVEKSAREAFDALLAEVKSRRPNVNVAGVLKHGSAWSEILATAEEIRADVVILGTHGRRGVPRAVLGSVAEKVVRTSPVPVLTIPGPHP
jgi:nucleotide-binding universal stress UspA family protein